MRMRFSSSFWILILYFGSCQQRIFVRGAARYEDEFQRSNFYTNEQGIGVEVERSPPEKGTAKNHYEGREVEEKMDKNGRSEANLQADIAATNEGEDGADIKSPRQNSKHVNKRFPHRDHGSHQPDQNGKDNHFRIPKERVQFIDGLDYQDRVDDDKNLVVLSREETRGLRQARKSCSDPVNNWKWGFKRKQVKAEHGMNDVAVYGGNHNANKHKEAAYARNQQDVIRGGHMNGETSDDSYSARQNVMPAYAKVMEQKNLRDETHQQAFQRQAIPDGHYHRGLARQRPDTIFRQDVAASPDVIPRPDLVKPMVGAQGGQQEIPYTQNTNFVHRPECSQKVYNWDMGNPRIYSAPKADNRQIVPVINNIPRVENSRVDYSQQVENPQVVGQRLQIEMDVNKMDNGQPVDEQKVDNVQRMDDQKNEEVPRIEHRRINEIGQRIEQQGIEPEVRYDNSNTRGYPGCCQRHENARNEAVHGLDNRPECCQKIDSSQRIDNVPVGDNYSNEGFQRIANTQRMKQPPRNYNIITGVPLKNGIQRLEPPVGTVREEEIRYLVFSPAEFNPMTLRTVLGESGKQFSPEIPFCTLEEYKVESASLRGKQPYDHFQDRQYRGKGYVNDLITRQKKNQEARKLPIRKPRIATKNRTECVQMPVHCCTAKTCKPKCPYGLVVQTEQYDPYEHLTTPCYIDALTRSTCCACSDVEYERITPSKMFENLRGHRPIISHFDNTMHTTCVFPCMVTPCPKAKGAQHRHRLALPLAHLSKPKRTPDLAMLSDIINEIASSEPTRPFVHPKRERAEEVEEQKIIEKYLTGLMEQQNNRSKAQGYTQNYFQGGGEWLGKLLEELAENKLRSRMRMNQPPKDEETPLIRSERARA